MIWQNLLLSLRVLRRQRTFTGINLMGLMLGLLASTFMVDYVYHENRFDRHHANANRIFRLTMHYKNQTGYNTHFARVHQEYINTMPEIFPEVEQLVRFQNYNPRMIKVGTEVFKERNAYATDSHVFEVFDFPLLQGSPKNALLEPNTLVLTASTAQKYFGTTQAVGKTLEILEGHNNQYTPYEVTAVMSDVPETTHMPITLLTAIGASENRVGWAYTYLLLKDPSSANSLAGKIEELIVEQEDEPENLTMPLQALTDIHLHSHLAREIKPGGQAWTIPLFLTLAGFVLVIALINYMNLSTAQSLARAREIGVRKTLGSSRIQLIQYFLGQSTGIAILSGVLAALLVPLVAIWYKQLTGFAFSLPWLPLVAGLLGFSFIAGVAAGLYPAFQLSGFKPIQVLKGKLPVTGHRKFTLRHGLVSFQFGISLLLVVCALVGYQQHQFLTSKDLGMQPDQVLAIRNLPTEANLAYPKFKEELSRQSAILEVSAVMGLPSEEIRDAGSIYAEGTEMDAENAPTMDIQVADHGYLSLMGMELITGTDFSDRLRRVGTATPLRGTTDLQKVVNESPQEYLINETAMRIAGFTSPANALGKTFGWSNGGLTFPNGPIVGVVKDFHQETLKNSIEPVVITHEPHLFNHILIKTTASNFGEAKAAIARSWKQAFPDLALDMVALSDLFTTLYQSEERQTQFVGIFSGLALTIAFLGLLGLIAYSLKTRGAEIAIRRVLGASQSSVLWLFGREYAKLLLFSTLIVIPLSVWGLQSWLQAFPYRVTLTPLPYVVAAIFLILIFGSNIVYQTLRHLRHNPVRTLRED